MKQVNFNGSICEVSKGQYAKSNQNAIHLIDAHEGSPVATASTCIPESPQKENEVYIKAWAENEGIDTVLIKAGIISEPYGAIPTGMVSASIHKLLI